MATKYKRKEERNWVATIMSGTLALFTGFGAAVCWTHLHSDPFMWISAMSLTSVSLLLLMATVSGRVVDFLLNLIIVP